MVLGAVLIVEETRRRGGEGERADQLPLLALRNRPAVVAEHFGRHTQAGALQLPAADGGVRLAQREAREDVGSAGDRSQGHVALKRLVHPVERLRAQHRARGQHRAHRRKVAQLRRPEAQLVDRIDELGRGPKVRDSLLVRQTEEQAWAS